MKTEIRLITPVVAGKMLEKNSMNRLIRQGKLNDYIRQMRAGLWKEETGESIKIATDGAILDGQHRLMAIVKADISLNLLIISGLEKDVFTVLDSGALRTAGDVFHIAGILNAKNVSAGVRRYFILKAGNTQFNTMRGITSTEALNLYNQRAKFWQGVYTMARGWYGRSSRILTIADFIGYYAFFHDIGEDDVFEFMSSLGEGTNLAINSPIRILREKLLFARANPKFSFLHSTKTALIYKSWNHFRNKSLIKILKYDETREPYPIAT